MEGSVATNSLEAFTVVFSDTWPVALESGFLVEELLNDSGCCIRSVSDVVSYSPTSRTSMPAFWRAWGKDQSTSLFAFEVLINGRSLLLKFLRYLNEGPVLRPHAPLTAVTWLGRSRPPPCPTLALPTKTEVGSCCGHPAEVSAKCEGTVGTWN
ncbi:hypothetical protein mRhiFer1_009258 [Rhinolophus ferrumequinum]|uniref:Uncharacterized protein n=1 Tax=Rhinolophus ferrumequinum TaxID=59479 RepID=A0A7J7S8G5_RHIFE|nr:hypothetical protein mRhiFer1_009258 [Rhinolophus ferrumequinum]